ncbi:MAG: hypothetical protein ACKVOS_08270 [Sphingorhabdus sp.]|uniref:hypothetical protein n=1 Tax=Sphingorhabdus sp. TaxID=1902408 RepID=UPI0038FCFA1C
MILIARSAVVSQTVTRFSGDFIVNLMAKTFLMTTAILMSSASIAQETGATQPSDEKINQLIVYGDDECPQSTGDEIVVCARMNEADRYRIPPSLRSDPNSPQNQAWLNRVQAYEYVGASGTLSCSPSGAGGFTGCGLKEIDRAYAEKAQDPGITFGRLIAAERTKRMAGIDAEAAAVEERVKEFEKGRAEREARLQAEMDAKEAAERNGSETQSLPEPK